MISRIFLGSVLVLGLSTSAWPVATFTHITFGNPGSIFSFLSRGIETQLGLKLTVRDSLTGARVQADIAAISDAGDAAARADLLGKGEVTAYGHTEVTVTAEGYSALSTYFLIGPDGLDVSVWLDPVDLKQRIAAVAASDETEPVTVISGYVYDAIGAPAMDVRVELDGVASAPVAADGYFELAASTPAERSNGLPGSGTLRVTRGEETLFTRTNTMLAGGKLGLILDIPGVKTSMDARHKFELSEEELSASHGPPAIAAPLRTLAPSAVTVPATIRVGSNCPTATTCTTFAVYSIDTYVRNGLDDEWIASWNANSVKAGAIAYRSYGAYHVYHPRNPANYDICNTTSCQVNDPTDTHANSNAATVQTTGSIVVNAAGTDVLFAEYSAENNLAPGCPDGSTGRPEHNWPCLADPVDVGTTYFGHGRGMCQWGSQRWSINQGKDFVWVVNHYYNANGMPSGLRSGVLQMGPDTLLPPPELTGPGTQTAPGVVVAGVTPTFQWSPVVGADGYSLYVSKFNGSTYDVVFNSETALGGPLTGTSYTVPSGILVHGGQYRWNMSSHIAAGYGTANTFRNYFTVSPTVSVSGKVTTPTGLGIRNALVTITDPAGIRRTATTSSFGIYTFTGVANGQTHTITASTKRYRFSPLIREFNDSVANADLVGLE